MAAAKDVPSNADLDFRKISSNGKHSEYHVTREGVDEDAGQQVVQIPGPPA